MKGIEYLREKLKKHAIRVDIRYRQYNMKYQDASIGITIPDEIRNKYRAVLGWCAKGVDSLADRLIFREFENDDFEVSEIFNMNNPDIFFDDAVSSALIASCCFVYISQGDGDIPRLQVIDAKNATGTISPITRLLEEGYAVLKRDEQGNPMLEAYFVPGATHYYTYGKHSYSIGNKVAHPLLVPIIHRPDADRPFGRSRITRAGMSHQRNAKRTIERAEVTGEFHSYPQKYVTGLSQDAELMETWQATVSSMLQFTKDDEGDAPKLGQFTTASMAPFTEQLRTAAAAFAGEMSLTLDDLGFVGDNPSSVEAIKAAHENLRLAGRKAQRCFSSGLINVGYVAACLRDEYPYLRSQLYQTKVKWEPMFEADASTLSLIGDGAIKINQAVPGYMDAGTLRDLTGVKGANE